MCTRTRSLLSTLRATKISTGPTATGSRISYLAANVIAVLEAQRSSERN